MKQLINLSVFVLLTIILSVSSVYGQSCDTLRNYTPGASYISEPGFDGLGTVSGVPNPSDANDLYDIDAWAEKYELNEEQTIKAVRFHTFGYTNLPNSSLDLVIYADDSGTPGTVLYSQEVAYADLSDPGSWSFIELTTPHAVNGTFWVGYELDAADYFRLYTTEPDNGSFSYFHVSGSGPLDDLWLSFEGYMAPQFNVGGSAFAFDILFSEDENPNPTITIANSEICISGEFEVDADASTGAIDSYVWQITNGTAGGIHEVIEDEGSELTIEPLEDVDVSEQKEIVLIVNGACVSRSTSASITVYPEISATVSLIGEICGHEDGEIEVADVEGGDGTYFYSIDNGDNTQSENTFTDLVAGDYEVQVTDGSGCVFTEDVTVSAIGAEITVSSDTTICEGETVTLTATVNGTDVEWFTQDTDNNFTVLAGTGEEISVSPSETTTYRAVLTIPNGDAGEPDCTEEADVTVTVNTPEEITIETSTPVEVCFGGTAVIEATGNGSIVWYADDGTEIIAGGEASVNPTTVGTHEYYAVLTDPNGCTDTSSFASVEVKALDDASFSYDLTVLCGDANPYSVTPTVGLPGGTFTVVETGLVLDDETGEINVNESNEGVYTVIYTVNDVCENSDTTLITITNPADRDAAFSYVADEFCSGYGNIIPTLNQGANAGVFDAPGLPFNPSTGEIDLNIGVSAGTYTITNTLAISGSCPEVVETFEIEVFEIPSMFIDANPAGNVCAGTEVTLTADIANPNPDNTFQWYVHDGTDFVAITDADEEDYVFTTTDTESYQVEVANATTGCSVTEEITINVNPLPTVDVTDVDVCIGETEATFTAMNIDTDNTIQWYKHDGTDFAAITDADDVILTVDVPTTDTTVLYQIEVTDNDNGCTTTKVVELRVNGSPTVDDISATDVDVCVGTAVTITADISHGTNIKWFAVDENDDATEISGETTNSLTVSPTETTTYRVEVTNDGCTTTADDEIEITVKPLPTVDVTDVEVCIGEETEVTFTATNIDADNTIQWYEHDGTDYVAVTDSTDVTLTVDVPTTDTTVSYQIIVTDNDNGCTTTEVVALTVNALPIVAVIADETEVCAGEEVTLTATTDLDNTVQWYVHDGTDFVAITDADEIEYAFTATDTATYQVEVTNVAGCVETAQITINVNALPTVDVTDVEVCVGEETEVTFTATNFDADNTIQWYAYDGTGYVAVTDSTDATLTVDVPTTDTTVSYQIIVTDSDNGCTTTEEVVLTVNALPTVTASADQTEVCAGEEVTLTADAPAGISWDNGVTDGTPFAPTATTTYTVTVDDNGCEATDEITITVNELPTVTIDNGDMEACVYNDVIELTATPAGGTFSGPGVTGNSFDPDEAGTGTHTITYTYEDAEGCENSATIEIEVDECVGISTNDLNSEVVLSPNPSTDYVDVAVVGNNQVVSIQVISLEGKIMNTRTEAVDAQTTRIDVSSLSTGTYLVQLSTDNGAVTKKIVVQ